MEPLVEMQVDDLLGGLMHYCSDDGVDAYFREAMHVPENVLGTIAPYLSNVEETNGQFASIDGARVFNGIESLKMNITDAMQKLYDIVGNNGYVADVNPDLSIHVISRDSDGHRIDTVINEVEDECTK